MSAPRFRLEHPVVIGIVALGLLGVAALNIGMFRSGNFGGKSGALTGSDPGGKGNEMLRNLMEAFESDTLGIAPPAARTAAFKWPKMARDPFRAKTGTAPQPYAIVAELDPWHCDAVVMRGTDTIALIDGVPYRIGEKVRKAVLIGIDKKGVTLLEGKKETKLAVSGDPPEEATFSIVLAGAKDRQETLPGPQGLGDHGGKR